LQDKERKEREKEEEKPEELDDEQKLRESYGLPILKDSTIKDAEELVRQKNSKIILGREPIPIRMENSLNQFRVIPEKDGDTRRDIIRKELIFMRKSGTR
jgi:hypothetical protein